ncbi:MAG: hypothetical protein R3F29_06195 [Planctomycetota bacterium]
MTDNPTSPWRGRRRVASRRHWLLCSALPLLLLGGVAAQDDKLPTEARIDDGGTSSDKHVFGDARSFAAKVAGDRIECVLTMAKPLVEGMFTMVELEIDCDDKPATGLDGRELRIRAAVGSRFLPSAAEPNNGGRKPIEHLRISGTELQPDGQGGKRWIHMSQIPAEPPVVKGNELHFWFPRRMVRERGDRYHGRMSMRVHVETSCSDQPIERLHACSDEGMPIELDGSCAEWSAPAVRDAGDELHEVARCIDLTSLRVDHGEDCLFACVETAAPGFLSWTTDDDVRGYPTITFLVEPMFPRYQDPYEIEVFGSEPKLLDDVSAGRWRSAAGESVVEVKLPRRKGQNRLRVIALSDLELKDWFGSELRLDAEGK